MSLNAVSAGRELPDDFNVVVEIPAHAPPVKYEVDKGSGALFVDRFLGTAMFYPCNYGYVPQTLSEDGDPVDVLVATPVPLSLGVVVRCRPLGMLRMEDEAGIDAKLLAVPVDKLCPMYQHIRTINDLPTLLLEQIRHFFEHYKDLEKGKWVKVTGWADLDAARAELLAGAKRYGK